MKQVRIWFEKKGRARYISHLDLNRTMARAIRRARLPVWHTEGFNPHPHIVFSLPAPLGIECCRESMDVRLIEDVPLNDIEERLNAQLPEGLKISGVTEPKMKISAIAFARYFLDFAFEGKSGDEVKSLLEQCLDGRELIIEKKTKSKTAVLNLREKLKDFAFDKAPDGRVRFWVVLPAGSKENINPALLVLAFERELNAEFDIAEVTRERLLTFDGKIFE